MVPCTIRVCATDDVVIKGLPYEESWILMDDLHRIGAKARSGSVPVHVASLPGFVTVVYASVDGGSRKWIRARRSNDAR